MQLTGADILIRTLIEQGCDTVFGYPGGQVINLFDELYLCRDRINHILTAHEQGASHAADGYARATGKVGVCIATSGPGATNLVTGIATAFLDSIPMVAITGNVPCSLIGKDSFQEAYIEGITMPITKHNFTVRKVEELADTMRAAFRIAQSGRKGPVLVDIPKDVTAAVCEFTPKQPEPIRTVTTYNEEQVHWAADLINAAQRPLVYFGGGVRSAASCQPLRDLLHKAEIPATYTLMAAGVVPYGDPMNLGMLGMHGSYAANMAVSGCDLLLAFGVRFDERSTAKAGLFAPAARIVHFNVEPGEINKIIPVQVAVPGDLKESLPLFSQLVEPLAEEFREQVAPWREQAEEMKAEIPCSAHACQGGISPEIALKQAAARAPRDTIVVTDVGQHQMWAAQFFPTEQPRHFLTSGGLGTMGFGLPAALGAKVGEPEKTVLLITGDGSILMNCQEFTTLPTYGIQVKTIVLKNGQLGMVRQLQGLFRGGRYSQTKLIRKPSMAKIAEAMGIPSRSISRSEELAEGLDFLFGSEDSALLEITIPEDERVYPVVPGSKGLDQMILGPEKK